MQAHNSCYYYRYKGTVSLCNPTIHRRDEEFGTIPMEFRYDYANVQNATAWLAFLFITCICVIIGG